MMLSADAGTIVAYEFCGGSRKKVWNGENTFSFNSVLTKPRYDFFSSFAGIQS